MNESFNTILALSKKFNKLPSEIMGVKDAYAAYCLNEACLILFNHIEQGGKLNYTIKTIKRHYNNFTDFYKQYQ